MNANWKKTHLVVWKSFSHFIQNSDWYLFYNGTKSLWVALKFLTSINDVRRFLTIFDPHPPVASSFYLLMSDFLGSFQIPHPSFPQQQYYQCVAYLNVIIWITVKNNLFNTFESKYVSMSVHIRALKKGTILGTTREFLALLIFLTVCH